tara:strand:- start:295 stop:696 length:402 start_codon:yes stop_codon:yes gene_type:complete
MLYYRNIDLIIIVYAFFLFFIILLKEFTKDLKNLIGDFSNNYKTIPVIFGEGFSKTIISLTAIINIILLFNLYINFSFGLMFIFYIVALILLIIFLIKLKTAINKSDYLLLYNILRLIIVIGVFSIFLININF